MVEVDEKLNKNLKWKVISLENKENKVEIIEEDEKKNELRIRLR